MGELTQSFSEQQQTYLTTLYEQAKLNCDINAELPFNKFKVLAHELGYSARFQQFLSGQRHKPTWQGLGVRVDLSDRCIFETKKQLLEKETGVYVYEGGLRQ
jgi:hypothetical protein